MKYGWEIADDVQRFASGSAAMQFVPVSEYEMQEKLHKAACLYINQLCEERDRYKAALENLEFSSICSCCERNMIDKEKALNPDETTKP